MDRRSILVLTVPAAAAIAVFGSLYGASARAVLGVPLALASSLIVFSGALQFALVALLIAGAGPLPLLLTAGALNLRHLVLGAVLRARLEASPFRRALLAFFLVDETFGFAIAAGNAAETREVGAATERTLLFIGLAALAATQRSHVVRALAAAVLTAALALALPDLRMVAPVIASALVALPGRNR